MQEYTNHTFCHPYNDVKVEITGLRLKRCSFDNCWISLPKNSKSISRLSDIVLEDCRIINYCDVKPAIFEDILVNNLSIYDILIF